MFSCDSEIIYGVDTNKERNVGVLCTLTRYDQNYRMFNEMREEEDYFIAMNSPWLFIYVIATNGSGNEEPCILSFHWRNQSGFYYLSWTGGFCILVYLFDSYIQSWAVE